MSSRVALVLGVGNLARELVLWRGSEFRGWKGREVGVKVGRCGVLRNENGEQKEGMEKDEGVGVPRMIAMALGTTFLCGPGSPIIVLKSLLF